MSSTQIVFGSLILLVILILVLCIHFRRIIRNKDRGAIRQIREYELLKKKLEMMRIEKQIKEEMLDKLMKNINN